MQLRGNVVAIAADRPTATPISRRRRLPSWLAMCAVAPLLISCRAAGVLDPQGPVAAAERLLLINATEIMLVVAVPVILATLGIAWWRYRATNVRAPARDLEWSYQGSVEFVDVVDSGPRRDPARRRRLDQRGISSTRAPYSPQAPAAPGIDVVSLDWKWLFIYLLIRASPPLNQLIGPGRHASGEFSPHLGDRDERVLLLRQLGSQIYSLAGMTTHLYLLADKPGRYPGLRRPFQRRRVLGHAGLTCPRSPEADFDAWVRQGQRVRRGARRSRLCRIDQAEQRRPAGHLSLGRSTAIRPASSARRRSTPMKARRLRMVPARPPQTGVMRCWSRSDLGGAIPFDEPILLITSIVVILGVLGILGLITIKGWWPYLWSEWITSVDHKRIGRHVAAGHAAARVFRRESHDAACRRWSSRSATRRGYPAARPL